jgi:rSAM/selenodomain-associated transferase 1
MHHEIEQPSTCAIAVMAKASIRGRAKTRLIPTLTPEQATDLNTSFLRDVADNLIAASALANITAHMAYAPAGSAPFFKSILPDSIGLIETVKPTLGECLLHAARTLLDAGSTSVCLLNSDSPTLPVAYLVAAATVLAVPGDRVVLGPSTDGGYYLIGIKQAHAGLFDGIDWSTERVFRQTVARAGELGLAVHELPTWYDVDDAASLGTLIGELFGGRPFRTCGSRPTPAAWTRRQLAELLAGTDLSQQFRTSNAVSRVA